MSFRFALSIALVPVFSVPAVAAGKIRITEFMHAGNGGEFVELTNVGDAPVDMTGFSFDDSGDTPGAFDLSAFGTVSPGESVVLTTDTPAAFAADWGLTGVVIIGGNTQLLDASDRLNVFDAASLLVDRLNYGVAFPGSIDTTGTGGWTHAEHVGQDSIFDWQLAVPADAQHSVTSASGDVGSPGTCAYLSENVTVYGAGCVGSGGFVPALAIYGIPAAGETLTMEVTDGPGAATCILFLGSVQGATPLLGGCTLWMTLPIYNVFPVFFLGGVGPGGGSVSIPAPLTFAPAAFQLDLQVVLLDAGVARGYSLSSAVAIDFP